MAERAYFSDTDDMLIDDDVYRQRSRGLLTEQKLQTIRLMSTRFGADPEAIASQLQLDLNLVYEEVAKLGDIKDENNPKPF